MAAMTARTVKTTPHCDEDRPKEPPARPSLRVFVEVFLHRRERIEPRDALIPPPVVPDVDPGHSPRRDELKHAEPDAREAEDQASDQFDHTDTISTPEHPSREATSRSGRSS